MAQLIKQADIFGRIGSGVGKGLAEQLPKEIERERLAAGLKDLSQKKGLTPFEQFTGLASVPGALDRPALLQTGGNLLRQQGIAEGFRRVGAGSGEKQDQINPLRQPQQEEGQSRASGTGLQKTPAGLVDTSGTQTALHNYIPKTRDQLMSRAADLYDENRALYPNPESAFTAAQQEDQQNLAISQAKQGERQSQIGVEDRLRGQLKGLREAANVQIPDNVFQQVENDVLDLVASGERELEAAKKGQEKLDEISRQYKEFDTVGNWTLPFKSPEATRRSINSLRNDFKKRDDLENFADSLVGRNGLSYSKAYSVAYPVKEYQEVDRALKGLPELKGGLDYSTGVPAQIRNEKQTLDASKKIAKAIKDSGASPLAVAEELRRKNYDPDVFLDYLGKNKQKLDLSERQSRELNKTRNWFPSLNDLWFFIGSGQDNLIED